MKSEKIKQNEQDDEGVKNAQKDKGILGKIGNSLKAGTKFIGEQIEKGYEKVKSNINEHLEQKELEKRLEELFNSESTKISLVLPDKKEKIRSINARIDYDKKVITIYGDLNQINTNCFFVDKFNQKFNISLIRLDQVIELTLDSTVFKRKVTVIEFILKNDEDTKRQMQTIINNNQITIENSVIKKSNIGSE